MKKSTKIIYASELILLIFIVFFSLFINRLSDSTKSISAIVVLFIIFTILLISFGIKRDKNYLKGNATRTVIAALMTFMLIIYGLGIFLGFNKGYISNDYTYFKNLILILIFIIELEFVRFLIVRNSLKDTKAIVIFTALSAILNILLELNLGKLTTAEDKFIFLSTIIFPIIAQESLCSYMTYKIALLPSLIYKLVIKLYIFVLPIIPNLGDYIYSTANIILPFALYSILNRMIIRYDKEKEKIKKINRIIFSIPIVIFLIILIILVSGVFKYKLIAVASNSMSPVYRRGDAVIYEKLKVEELEAGDILAFQKESRIVTHRIVKIWKQDGEYYFTTKGDANNDNDKFTPSAKNVLGKVEFKFKYIGYPTVLINEYFGKE